MLAELEQLEAGFYDFTGIGASQINDLGVVDA